MTCQESMERFRNAQLLQLANVKGEMNNCENAEKKAYLCTPFHAEFLESPKVVNQQVHPTQTIAEDHQE